MTTWPCELPGAVPHRPGLSPAQDRADAALLASLEAERARPDVGEHVAGYATRLDVAEALQTVIALLASLFRKGTA